jgi:hypothetical protein
VDPGFVRRLRSSLLVLALLASASEAQGQVRGFPVYGVQVPQGITLSGDAGFASDDFCSAPSVCLGATVMAARGRLGATATVATSGIGAMVDLSLLRPRHSPFGLVLQGGLSGTSLTGGALVVPFGAGFSAWVPTPVVSLEPWLAARGQYMNPGDGWVGNGAVRFGWSAGINLSLLDGLGVRAAYDRTYVTDNTLSTFGIGVYYSFDPGH